ncbi:excalibur calcium-binding domain-containing protein [Nocardia sp. NBC_00416]|uniref:excalibur calcium-binding domain-containing protein n=1 Tax=Nocardia sp. NBC_00416 TaxID=2975991 RepID=UPI002E24FEDF
MRRSVLACAVAVGCALLPGCGGGETAATTPTVISDAPSTAAVAPVMTLGTPVDGAETAAPGSTVTSAPPPVAAPVTTLAAVVPVTPSVAVAPAPPPFAVPPAPESGWTPEPTVAPPSVPAPSATYFGSCAAARAAGVAPLHRGEPGYRPGLDRDGDGVACER